MQLLLQNLAVLALWAPVRTGAHKGGALVLRKPAKPARAGWAAAAQKIAERSDDALVMGEFGNEADVESAW